MKSEIELIFKGGIGNQLLQFAAGVFFAEMFDARLLLNSTYYTHNDCHSGFEIPALFNVKNSDRIMNNCRKSRYSLKRKVYIGEDLDRSSFSHSRFIDKFRPTRLVFDGYFLTSYFILQTRTLLTDMMSPFEPQDPDTCFMHVRRGDFMKPENMKNYRSLGLDYYSEAISTLLSTRQIQNVLIVSDDHQYCHDFLIPELKQTHPYLRFEVSSCSTPAQDFQLLLGASMLICANSTFSASAALFNEKCEVVMPKKWFHKPSFAPYSIHRPEAIII